MMEKLTIMTITQDITQKYLKERMKVFTAPKNGPATTRSGNTPK